MANLSLDKLLRKLLSLHIEQEQLWLSTDRQYCFSSKRNRRRSDKKNKKGFPSRVTGWAVAVRVILKATGGEIFATSDFDEWADGGCGLSGYDVDDQKLREHLAGFSDDLPPLTNDKSKAIAALDNPEFLERLRTNIHEKCPQDAEALIASFGDATWGIAIAEDRAQSSELHDVRTDVGSAPLASAMENTTADDRDDVPQWDEHTEARNKWVYEQCCDVVKYSAIISDLKNKKPKTWGRLNQPSSVKKAASAYADRHGKPPIPRRAKGRPKSK